MAPCTSGDPKDKRHAGLLLAKTGPTGNFASAGATLQGVKGIMLTELGYDHPEGRILDTFFPALTAAPALPVST